MTFELTARGSKSNGNRNRSRGKQGRDAQRVLSTVVQQCTYGSLNCTASCRPCPLPSPPHRYSTDSSREKQRQGLSEYRLHHEQLHLLAIKQRYCLVVHKYNSPLESSEPQASVTVWLIFPDDDWVWDGEQTHLQRKQGKKRGWMSCQIEAAIKLQARQVGRSETPSRPLIFNLHNTQDRSRSRVVLYQ